MNQTGNFSENLSRKIQPWHWVAAILAAGLIISTLILTNGLVKMKASTDTITVTGSAKQEIKSDLIVWSGTYSYQAPTLIEAYQGLDESQKKVEQYFLGKGIDQKDLVFSSVMTAVNRTILPNGMYSNDIESYTLSQNVEISSKDVDKVTLLSREATELINQGVGFQSNMPQYFYTKIADLKVEMLALATKDAFNRAEQIAENSKSKIGALRSAKMGVMQITPRYSNEVSDYGINDISSLEKEITAVVNCSFTVK